MIIDGIKYNYLNINKKDATGHTIIRIEPRKFSAAPWLLVHLDYTSINNIALETVLDKTVQSFAESSERYCVDIRPLSDISEIDDSELKYFELLTSEVEKDLVVRFIEMYNEYINS